MEPPLSPSPGSLSARLAELARTSDGSHLWSHTFERERRGIFAMQDEIAAAVVEALKVTLLPGRPPSSPEFRTAVPGVYDLYLQGRRQQRRDYGPEWLEAEAAFQKALALDPDYAPAWAALATALYFNHGNSSPSTEVIHQGKARALAAAERAVALAPDLAGGYAARAQLRVLVHRDWAGGLADMERATLLSPGDPELLWRQARATAQRALDTNDGGLPDIRMEPLLFRLHADPRYPALLARIGLPAVEPR